jgi:mono/diheme cytochrome c family protein
MTRRILVPLIVVAVAGYVVLMVLYEVIGVDIVSFMEDQPSIHYQEGPRRLPPEDSVPLSRPAYLDEAQSLANPVHSDGVSLQRGEVLFGYHCAVCHGQGGQGDGPIVEFWREDARKPPDLTEARIGGYSDETLYRIITQGLGGMPPLRENLTERQRWDVINYVRTLQP